jgi:hypothetical protein
MKNTFLLYLFLLSTLGSLSQSKNEPVFSPPNGVLLYDSIFMDATELSNLNYLEYLYYVRQDSALYVQNPSAYYLQPDSALIYERNKKIENYEKMYQWALIHDSTYEKTTQKHYEHLLEKTKKQNPFEFFYQSLLPDSDIDKHNPTWSYDQFLGNSVYTDHYFRYPGFRYFPLVGVSYHQAVNYCKFRTKVVNEILEKDSKWQNYDIRVEFRLPTEKEWEYAASGGLNIDSFPYGIVRPVNKKYYKHKIKKDIYCVKCLESLKIPYRKNDYIHKMEFNVMDDYATVDSTIACYQDTSCFVKGVYKNDLFNGGVQYEFIYSNYPNKLGIYNMIGNVAELLAEKGIAKGGSYKDYLKSFNIKSKFNYIGTTEWLGFRCVSVVHIKRKIK